MDLPIRPPFAPMEATLVRDLPEQGNWQFEPKWDGFRCLVFRDGERVELQSKSGLPLTKYFPELVDSMRALRAKHFVLDGEIVVPVGETTSFDDLLLRMHPAASRIARLSKETPAELIAFDLLVDADGRSIAMLPLRDRREALESFVHRFDPRGSHLRLSPATSERARARQWERALRGHGIDGIVAKKLDAPYASGDRTAMEKVKWLRTADCVVGGFRYGTKTRLVGSLLLGLYDDEGLLHHVGFCANIPRADRAALTRQLERLVAEPGFTGSRPGGPSRWNRGRETEWEPLEPKLVVEVTYDAFAGGRFRHGTSLQRFRPDKAPRQCTFEQVAPPRKRAPKQRQLFGV